MSFPRASGILLHPTSLPGKSGIGDFGNASYEFIDFLVDTGHGLEAAERQVDTILRALAYMV